MLDVEALSEMMAGIVAEEVDKAIAPLKAQIAELEARDPVAGPPGEKGEAGENGADGKDGADGASITVEQIVPLIEEQVVKSVAEIPVPKDGKDGVDGTDGKDGADGRGVKSLLIDRDGELVATMDDGTVKSLGPVIGKDGTNGIDGAPGKDGRDGIELDSFDAIVTDDDRTVELKFVSGDVERVASFKWPVMIDRGVYKAGDTYDAGDAVSWGGSVWIAQKETDAKPDTADSGWRLAVKRGRDGKDAKVG